MKSLKALIRFAFATEGAYVDSPLYLIAIPPTAENKGSRQTSIGPYGWKIVGQKKTLPKMDARS